MEIENSGINEITISGNIKSIKDYQMIRQAITDILATKPEKIAIRTPESFSITSSVIGFLLKVVFQDKVKIVLYVKDARLYGLLEDLKLIETFNVISL